MSSVPMGTQGVPHVFSPLVGEMAGRPEGGVRRRHHSAASAIGAGEKSSGKCVIALITG
ncbi:hypothetical protein EFR01_44590 [Sinorhizobium fredii]|nr:hypothetical protein EFR01_44590 [Sinorhizobium fredii]GLS12470.1 hypothetical protein GCM10007864_61030 [Sinorhizobium fredii]